MIVGKRDLGGVRLPAFGQLPADLPLRPDKP